MTKNNKIANVPSVDLDNTITKDCYDNIHDYVRHVFTCFITWNGVFTTFNLATMGYLNVYLKDNKLDKTIAHSSPILFITINILGIVASIFLIRYMDRLIRFFKNNISDNDSIVYLSISIYKNCISLMAAGLLLVVIAWIFILFHINMPI